MPYYRRRGYYKKPYKKRYYKKKKGNIFWRRLRNKALYGGLKALRYLNVEKKPLDSRLTAQAVSTTAGVSSTFWACTQGDGESNRDGNQIKVISVLYRYMLTLNNMSTNSEVRIMLVLDKQCNGAAAAFGDVVDDTTAGDALISPYNLDNKFRFKVLYDKLHLLNVDKTTISAQKMLKFNLRIRYDGNAGDITDLTSYNLLEFRVSNEATNTPTMTRVLRTRFVDN